MTILLAAVLAGVAAALWVPGSRDCRRAPPRRRGGRPDRGVLLASGLAGAACWGLVGGWVGLLAGAAVTAVAASWLARLEPAALRRRRLSVVRAAPVVADLLAAGLVAGIPVEHAVPVIARAFGGEVGRLLMQVHRRTELGEPGEVAWSRLRDVPGLGGIARAVARSSRTGAPLATLLSAAATDLRAQASAAAVASVRSTAVRAVLPLGLCLLPAFVLLGITPIVGGLLPDL